MMKPPATATEADQAAARDAFLAATGRHERRQLGAALRDHAFERSGCHMIHPEVVMAARKRGSAAECAEGAWLALRQGKVTQARGLLFDALHDLDEYDQAMR